MAVPVTARAGSIDAGSPRTLFDTGIVGSFVDRRNQYVVTRDGTRFLVNVSSNDTNRRRSRSS